MVLYYWWLSLQWLLLLSSSYKLYCQQSSLITMTGTGCVLFVIVCLNWGLISVMGKQAEAVTTGCVQLFYIQLFTRCKTVLIHVLLFSDIWYLIDLLQSPHLCQLFFNPFPPNLEWQVSWQHYQFRRVERQVCSRSFIASCLFLATLLSTSWAAHLMCTLLMQQV